MTTFTREDWSLFRTVQTLSQKAGVSAERLAWVVAKELADNALDVAGDAKVYFVDDGGRRGFSIADRGPGIPGTDADVARLFSIARPLVSSKLLRLPSRGALGNGLRVVAGAVLASGGDLFVATQGRRLRLQPQDNGETVVVDVEPWHGEGTEVTVFLGPALPFDSSSLAWAKMAARFAHGDDYKGKTSPHWYDADAFFELLQAAGARPIRELVADLDACSGAKAGKIAAAAGLLNRSCESVTREEAEALLAITRRDAKPVKARRLGRMGDADDAIAGAYVVEEGAFELKAARGGLHAVIPFVVEAWVDMPSRKQGEDIELVIAVNKTPITAPASAWYHDNRVIIDGAGLRDYMGKIGRIPPRSITLNVMTPYMPITSDGKAPDLLKMLPAIGNAVEKAASKAKRGRGARTVRRRTQKEIIFDNVEAGRRAASDGGRYRFSQRQLFYALRPILIEETGQEPNYDTFVKVLTEYEEAFGDIKGMYRDARGTLYHPHLREEIPLGTLDVEGYTRPEWTFNKILYVEKEGFFPILRAERWPETHDCALLSSKGQATRAAKDLLDLLGETGEELTFYCIHDADAYGTLIYQALQEGTAARPGRKVRIVNLGLEPEEALDMGLQVEPVTQGTKRHPVGDYVPDHWEDWLQRNRVELNAMTTPVFLAWLDGKMAEHGAGKIIPPPQVARVEFETAVEGDLRRRIGDRILEEAGLDDQVKAAFADVMASRAEGLHLNGDDPDAALVDIVAGALATRPAQLWREPVKATAGHLVERYLGDN